MPGMDGTGPRKAEDQVRQGRCGRHRHGQCGERRGCGQGRGHGCGQGRRGCRWETADNREAQPQAQ